MTGRSTYVAPDITGMRFGKLVVLSKCESAVRPKTQKKNIGRWLCRCDCGQETVVRAGNLRNGHTQSCGCLRISVITRHGKYQTPEYHVWQNMIARCTNPKNRHYHNYGRRGITVCEQWRDFTNFFSDMGPRPSPKHSLERTDNDGNYEPVNCTWATRNVQSLNRRTTRYLTLNGKTQPITYWARDFGIDPSTLRHRIDKLGMPLEEALIRGKLR